jgi:hypothetical protein
MPKFRFVRLILLALLVCLIPAASSAAVLISVGFAPPPLPVYVQPPCPEPGWMWTPGYWAYGDDGYYWVPGTWVPAPYVGALWTPGYWGWNASLYVWHPGYWGPHVGYYGGVNYGFGFFGVGFVGGAWHGGVFAYNTAVVHVNTTVIHNTYVDRTVIVHNDNRVAFNGGPGGISHMPTPAERMAEHDQHMAATSFQVQHRNAAMQDRGSYFNNNHGRPNNAAMERPMGGQSRGSFNNNAGRGNSEAYHESKMGGTNPLYEEHGRQVSPRPSNTGGGQQHGQPGMAVKSQGVPDHPQPQSHEQHGGQGNQGHDHGRDR